MITVRIAGPLLKADGDPAVLERLQPWINAMVPLALAVKQRVQQHGKVVGEQPTYSPTTSGYKVTPEYASAAGAGDGDGKHPGWWRSSLSFHDAAGAKAGTGQVTGGMWAGFQVRTYGQNAVVMDFAGSSLGREGLARISGTMDKRAGKNGAAIKMLNSDKAGTLWAGWNVNVTQPTDDEQEALEGAVLRQAQVALSAAFGVEVPPEFTVADMALFHKISAAWITK